MIQDVTDAGHFMVNTRWASEAHAAAVLGRYREDAKIKRIAELIPERPAGFVGEILD